MTDVQIKHMVDRFLGWRLPQPWHPDNGISYQRPDYAHPPADHDWPTGTNLFDADQAEAMVRYMVEEMPGDEVEFGWVIERGDSTPATPTYWAGSEYWSQDHMDAVRFARKQDAERVACRLHGGYHRVCEHGWHKLPEQGMLVRFNHEREGGPVHRVASIDKDGMVELHDMGGFFAPHLFVIADDIADIPPTRKIGVDPACYDLARHFLVDRDFDTNELRGDEEIAADLKSLSEEIQIAVERWFSANEGAANE